MFKVWEVLFLVTFLLTILAIALLVSSCRYKECGRINFGDMRCNGRLMEVCDGEFWHAYEDCGDEYYEDSDLIFRVCEESPDHEPICI